MKDVALHLLGGDLSNIARRRDGQWIEPTHGESVGQFVNRMNHEWVDAALSYSSAMLSVMVFVLGAGAKAPQGTLA